ncbi:hypothetical protein [Cytobacillus sp. IB215665]|uniref:hypothetical protein n=1 Tax=Cytobacillus sp. IB215665 TaxID=3097357 RepID=UPI002A0E210A|nr:hypothetical protein [Cytobacillus sp. IB215665]MDX8364572.1 hypothetical protein [Cytobacillus sp. IB215665]
MLILITALIIIAVVASIAAWKNTETILRDLSEIKKYLNISEEKNSYFDSDLDKE